MLQMTADQARFLLETYLPVLKMESGVTEKVLASVPGDQVDYRPHEHSKSAMELVRHIANADNRFIETVISGVFNPGPGIAEGAKTPAQIAAWYAEVYARNHDALAHATSEQLIRMVDFRGMFSRPAVTFLMTGLHHTIHHRGQLSSYLRSMGAKVPAIYGESYDSAQVRKAAQA